MDNVINELLKDRSDQNRSEQNYKAKEYKDLTSVFVSRLQTDDMTDIKYIALEDVERFYVYEDYISGVILICMYLTADNVYKKCMEFNMQDILHLRYYYDDCGKLYRLRYTLKY